MGVDEIGVGKGHNYWTLLSALEGPRGPEMLYVVEVRSEKRLKRFWRWFGKERAALITHAVMDMCRAFQNSFRTHCRKDLQIIFDKFHVCDELRGLAFERSLAALDKIGDRGKSGDRGGGGGRSRILFFCDQSSAL